jgi:flagellar biosynthesis/type III secretory pathway protein FliH
MSAYKLKMADFEDFCLNIEENAFSQGHQRGLAKSREKAEAEATTFAYSQGYEAAKELYFYLGF